MKFVLGFTDCYPFQQWSELWGNVKESKPSWEIINFIWNTIFFQLIYSKQIFAVILKFEMTFANQSLQFDYWRENQWFLLQHLSILLLFVDGIRTKDHSIVSLRPLLGDSIMKISRVDILYVTFLSNLYLLCSTNTVNNIFPE